MKNYTYLEVNAAKGIGFALAYVALIIIILSFAFGGFLGLADAVNNFGSSKGLGFLVGIVCIAPIFFLMKFIYPKINLTTNDKYLLVNRKNQPDLVINYDQINAIALNAQRLNTLTIYGQSNEVLFHIQPFNNHHLMAELVKDITAKNSYKKSVTQKRMLNTSYDMVVYQRG
ncbi:MAG: hypothetical protein EOO86_00930 [Pedobacter sp.]|nr:MAG: hypothetical protein EOO86_00930 [Pedobacter sp.]